MMAPSRQISQRFSQTAVASTLLLLLIAANQGGRCSVLRNASTTPGSVDSSPLPDVVMAMDSTTLQHDGQPAAAVTSATPSSATDIVDLSTVLSAAGAADADDDDIDDDDEDDEFKDYSEDDDESFMSGTAKADVPPATSTATNSSSICSQERCGNNKFCVEDPEFRVGYRCCKRKPCSKSAGRYCDDPGMMGLESRTPTIRRRRKFKPKERIFFYCEAAGYAMICQDNGEWKQDPVTNPCLFGSEIDYMDLVLDTAPVPDPTRGPPREPRIVVPRSNATEKLSIIVIVVSSCIVVFLIYLSIRYGRKRCEQSLVKTTTEKSNEPQRKPQPAPMPDLMSSSVSIDDFQSYVNDRHSGSDFLFLQEFQTIQNESSSQQYTTEASNLMENVEKNRYNNIVAYDHTRVHLKELKKQNTPFDYINANYVSGFTNLQAFIACQGPLPSTFSDFWEMVWTNNVSVIVMITNLIENGRRKCDQYWPTEGKEAYKYITVSAKTTETYANYTIRTFMLKNNKLTKRPKAPERRVVQYHYTQWPDHGTPDYVLPVLSFISKSSSGDQTAPIVVHCSAGVGRTGTYIAIQSMIKMLQTTGSVNIPTFLRHIRTQRNHLVQTQDQYVFVHDAVLEYIKVGSTDIKRKDLLTYYTLLLKAISNETARNGGPVDIDSKKVKNTIEKQFYHMKRHLEVMVDNNFATRTVNRNKNRQGALLPVFKSCVRLRDNNSSEEGSEYINASYLQGYRNSAEFIITQLPIESTRKDFWQLVWDVNCSVIVTLGDDQWDDTDDNYWPTQEKPSQFASFKVTFSQEEQTGDVIQRTFVLEATKDDYVLMVKQFHIRCWNEVRPTRDNAEVVAMVSTYAATKEGSTIIQDRFGSTSAAQFACWTSMHDRLENDDSVDVYLTAVLACQMRPGVFTSFNHLLYLYDAAVMEAKMTDNQRRSAGNISPPDLLPTPDPPRRDCINCTTAGEEAVTLLTFNHETA